MAVHCWPGKVKLRSKDVDHNRHQEFSVGVPVNGLPCLLRVLIAHRLESPSLKPTEQTENHPCAVC